MKPDDPAQMTRLVSLPRGNLHDHLTDLRRMMRQRVRDFLYYAGGFVEDRRNVLGVSIVGAQRQFDCESPRLLRRIQLPGDIAGEVLRINVEAPGGVGFAAHHLGAIGPPRL